MTKREITTLSRNIENKIIEDNNPLEIIEKNIFDKFDDIETIKYILVNFINRSNQSYKFYIDAWKKTENKKFRYFFTYAYLRAWTGESKRVNSLSFSRLKKDEIFQLVAKEYKIQDKRTYRLAYRLLGSSNFINNPRSSFIDFFHNHKDDIGFSIDDHIDLIRQENSGVLNDHLRIREILSLFPTMKIFDLLVCAFISLEAKTNGLIYLKNESSKFSSLSENKFSKKSIECMSKIFFRSSQFTNKEFIIGILFNFYEIDDFIKLIDTITNSDEISYPLLSEIIDLFKFVIEKGEISKYGESNLKKLEDFYRTKLNPDDHLLIGIDMREFLLG